MGPQIRNLLTRPNLQRLEREVVKGLKVYRYNGAERIKSGFAEPLRCPSSLGVRGQRTFVGLTNGTSHERGEHTNPFFNDAGKIPLAQITTMLLRSAIVPHATSGF